MLVVLIYRLVLVQILFVKIYNINYKKNLKQFNSIQYKIFPPYNNEHRRLSLIYSICLTSESTPLKVHKYFMLLPMKFTPGVIFLFDVTPKITPSFL